MPGEGVDDCAEVGDFPSPERADYFRDWRTQIVQEWSHVVDSPTLGVEHCCEVGDLPGPGVENCSGLGHRPGEQLHFGLA